LSNAHSLEHVCKISGGKMIILRPEVHVRLQVVWNVAGQGELFVARSVCVWRRPDVESDDTLHQMTFQ